MILFIGV